MDIAFEEAFRALAPRWLCGVDEAGRGPLAGPVVAAAVVLNPLDIPEGVDDSKKLRPAKRERVYEDICRRALAYGIGWASVEEIDRLNILQATFLAMRRAVAVLPFVPEHILVDGNQAPPGLPAPVTTIVKGDRLSISVAAASILAKVTRDRKMVALSEAYPAYGFEQHKGYGTAAHFAALREYGLSPIHRRSFLTSYSFTQKDETE